MEIPHLLDRVIIGPSQYPSATAEAFDHLLGKAGVPNAAASQNAHVDS
jgi:hypothetical protein